MILHNAVITGSLTLNGTDIGDITGSEAAINALNIFSSSIYAYTASNDTTNTTQNNRLSSLEITSGSLLTASGSFSTRVTTLETASGSFSTRVTNTETTASNLTVASSSFSTRVTNNEATGSNLVAASASFSTRVANTEATASSLTTASGSFSTRTTNLETASGSFSTRVTTNETNISNLQTASGSFSTRVTSAESSIVSLQGATGSYATTGSNNFVNTQRISATNNAIGFTSTASLYTDGGLRVTKDAYVSGTLYLNNLTVYGTQSVQYITASQLNISTNIISVNTDTPSIRYGGLSVYDSGSTGLTGSLLWDSEANHWIYNNPSGSTYSGGMLISGPRASALGSEQGTTACALMMGQGGDHITSSAIFHYGNATCFYGNSRIDSSGNICNAGSISSGNLNTIAYSNSGACAGLFISNTAASTVGNTAAIWFGTWGGASTSAVYNAKISAINVSAGDAATDLAFYTYNGAGTCSGIIERLRITNAGVSCFSSTVCAGGYVSSEDVRIYRSTGTTTGYINFGSTGTNYFGFDGSKYVANGAISATTIYGSTTVCGLSVCSAGNMCVGGNSLINGCVAIGCSSIPSVNNRLVINSNGNTNDDAILILNNNGSANAYTSIGSYYSNGNCNVYAQIRFGNEVASGAPSYISFATTTTNNPTEKLRITSTGIACFSSTVCAPKLVSQATNDQIVVKTSNNNGSRIGHDATGLYFVNDDSTICTLRVYGGNTGALRFSIDCNGVSSFACQVCAPAFVGGTVSGTTGTFSGKLSVSQASTDFVAEFTNTANSTPYGLRVKDAGTPANNYPLLSVTNNAGSAEYFRVNSGTGMTTFTGVVCSACRICSAGLTVEGTFINNGTTGDVAYISSTFATAATNGRVLHIRDNKAAIGTDSYVSVGWTSSPGQDVYIGKRTTSSAGFLAIQNSSATELLTIDLSSANVGIGTTSPGYKAEAAGAIGNYWNGTAFTGTPLAIAISNTQPGGYDPVLLYRQTDSGGTTKLAGGIGVVGRSSWTAGNNGSQVSDMYFLVRNDSGGITERMRIASGGNVGIGTSSPQDKLYVVGADNGITICSATANRPVLNFINGSTSMLKLSANGTYGAIASCTGDLMYFYGDKIGVGITSPSFAFEVNSSNNTAITSNNTFGANFNIIFNRDNTGGTRNCFNLLADQNAAYLRTLNNYPMVFVTNGTERMRITNDGIACFACTVCTPTLAAATMYYNGRVTEKVGSRNGTGTYSLFTNGSNSTQSSGTVFMEAIYGTPNTTGQWMYKIGGNRDIYLSWSNTTGYSGSTPTIAWYGSTLCVDNSNSSVYYSITIRLNDIGNSWVPTWGNFPGF